jgi:transposase
VLDDASEAVADALGGAAVEDGMGQAARRWHHRRGQQVMESPMPQPNDLSRCLTAFEQNGTIVAVVEMSQSSWLVAGMVPGVARHPLKKLAPDAGALLALLRRWQNEATRAGCSITRIAVAYEAGRDGFWLARWLRARSIEAQVIHPTSVAVSREHRRAKTDRLDTSLLKRAFLGWLRGEPDHCSMAAIPTLEAEDAKRPNREHQTLVGERTRIVNRMKGSLARFGVRGFKPTLRRAAEHLAELRTPEDGPLPPNTLAELRRDMARLCVVKEQIREIEAARLVRLTAMPDTGPHAMVRLLARVIGLGLETADMLVHEILSRDLRDRRAVARFAGLTGAPDESGKRRRDKGLAKAGSARVRRGMIQLAWRFLLFQRDSALAQWYRARTADARGGTRKTMIVALARKLLIALWRLVTTGEAPEGVALRPAT